ncbi:MAG: hypothetical protein PHX93_04850 [Candidatus Peribacteraceae bacterium]|nr:hypothetical protein [Candidatus Peribacteraceae bacterium]
MPTPETRQKLLPGIRPESVEVRRLTSIIEACKDRTLGLCRELGIPDTDSRCRGPIYRTDMAVSAARRWEGFGGPSPMVFLRQVRRELLLKELVLRGEYVDPHEQSSDAAKRIDAHVRLGDQSVLPLAEHLRLIQDTSSAKLAGVAEDAE